MMTWGRVYWPIFLIISSAWIALGFGIPETIALVANTLHLDNTLSKYARSELGISVATAATVHSIAWWCSFSAWMIFVLFITGHIWFDQFG
jgi:hypothetical protein